MDRNIHPHSVELQPPQARISQVETKIILGEAKHSAVLNHRAVIFAKAAVKRLADRALCRVASHHAIDELERVASANLIFVKRRDIDQPGRVANRVVLVIVHHVVGPGDKVT